MFMSISEQKINIYALRAHPNQLLNRNSKKSDGFQSKVACFACRSGKLILNSVSPVPYVCTHGVFHYFVSFEHYNIINTCYCSGGNTFEAIIF